MLDRLKERETCGNIGFEYLPACQLNLMNHQRCGCCLPISVSHFGDVTACCPDRHGFLTPLRDSSLLLLPSRCLLLPESWHRAMTRSLSSVSVAEKDRTIIPFFFGQKRHFTEGFYQKMNHTFQVFVQKMYALIIEELDTISSSHGIKPMCMLFMISVSDFSAHSKSVHVHE